jgi:polyhydroxybutyrate depolymerase
MNAHFVRALSTARRVLLAAALLGGGCVGVSPLSRTPHFAGAIQRAEIQVGERTRSYLYYVPQSLSSNAAIVFVLHGSNQTPQQMRVSTGYEFERLAARHGFLVVYPAGYRRHWNDCRKAASYAARRRDMDDKGFICALVEHFRSTRSVDPGRVYVMGYSNGGQLAYRLALEMPDRVTAIAVVGANLPVDENCDCFKSGRPIPVFIMNGTGDPINPCQGGNVRLFGFASRGRVISARESAEYFARLNGYHGEARVSRQGNRLPVEITSWREAGKPEVTLATVQGGGHVVPQPRYSAPPYLGLTTHAINGPEEIWEFFTRQPLLPLPER